MLVPLGFHFVFSVLAKRLAEKIVSKVICFASSETLNLHQSISQFSNAVQFHQYWLLYDYTVSCHYKFDPNAGNSDIAVPKSVGAKSNFGYFRYQSATPMMALDWQYMTSYYCSIVTLRFSCALMLLVWVAGRASGL